MATRPWRNCRASIVLADEINRRWPARDRASDGTVGDAAHATRASDHNPHVVVAGVGVVRARDIDKDGIDAPWLAEYLRQLGAAGDRRLAGGGYLIFNRRITRADFTGWRAYTGSNPHTSHLHVSFSRNPLGFDSPEPWGIWPPPPPPAPPARARPELREGATGPLVLALQSWLNAMFPRYSNLNLRPQRYGPNTVAVVREWQANSKLAADGVFGPDSWREAERQGFRG